MKTRQDGFVLLLTLVEGVVFLIILTGVISLSLANYKSARLSQIGLQAQSVAEAGADAALANLNTASNQGTTYTGTTTPVANVCALATSATSTSNAVVLYSDSTKGKATYETCIQDSSASNINGSGQNRYEKTIYAVGKLYQPQNAAHPTEVRRVMLIAEGSQSGGYAVQTGPGGLVMSNSSTITNGSVAIGGTLNMSNTAQIGSASSPVQVQVANYACPTSSPYTNYPQACASGNPIQLNNQAHIYGSVSANGQTDGSDMSNAGLVASSGVAQVVMPTYNRAAQKSAVAATMTASAASCSGTGSVTWPANVHITGGNVSLSNSCTVTVLGNAWIDGALSLSNSSTIKTGSGLSTTPTIMIDGSSGLSLSNQGSVATNSNGIGISFITFYSTASCNPDCSSVTGVDLVNSQSKVTISLNNQTLGAGSSFYAYWSELTLSNGGSVGSIMAQKIVLSNSGNISFGGSSSSGTFAWSVRYYDQLPVPDARTTN